MECFGTTDFDNNSRLITLSVIIISGLHCIKNKWIYFFLVNYNFNNSHAVMLMKIIYSGLLSICVNIGWL